MKAYTHLLLVLVLFTAACHKKSGSTTATTPGTTPVKPSPPVVPDPTPVPVSIVTYPYTDTFYGILAYGAGYPLTTTNTPTYAYVEHTSATTIRFSCGYFQYAAVFTDNFHVNDSNRYGMHFKKDYFEYKLSHDSLFYSALDTHGPDFDRWDYTGKKK